MSDARPGTRDDSGTPLPGDLQSLIDALQGLDRDAIALADGLGPFAFNWSAAPGRSWSIGQCIDHLARGNAIYLAALARAAEEGRARGLTRRGPLRPDLLGGLFAKSLEPPVRFRVRTWKVMVPDSRLDPAPTMAAF